MLRSFICRPCLQRLQQHGHRPFSTGRVQQVSRDQRRSPNPGYGRSNALLFRKYKCDAGKSTLDRKLPKPEDWRKSTLDGKLPKPEDWRKSTLDRKLPKPGDWRKSTLDRKLPKPEDWRQKVARQKIDPWGQELARDKIYRRRESGLLYEYLRKQPRESEPGKSGAQRWADWKDHFLELFKRMAEGDAYEPLKAMDWISDREAVENAVKEWSSWHNEEKFDRWHTLMFSALWSCPDRALAVLETTARDFAVPGYAMSDVIHFLAKWQNLRLEGEDRTAHARSLCDLTIAAFGKSSYGPARLRQNTIYNLSRSVDVGHVAALYGFMREKGPPLHSYTLLSIASRLADSPFHKQLALEIAIQASADGAVLNESHWASLCTSILTTTPEDAKVSSEFSAADAFSILLDHGFTPNMALYTALIRNLCVSGQAEMAWTVFEVMKQHRIEPDLILLSTLIDGAKRTLSASTINRLVEEVVERKTTDAVFLNDLLFSVLHFSEEEARGKKNRNGATSIPAFGPMLFLYSRVFEMGPLQALIPWNLAPYADTDHPQMPDDWILARRLFPTLETVSSAVKHKLAPTGATLSIMVIGYVKSITQPISLISLYAYFRQQILRGNTVATNHVREKGTVIYDVIIKALCEHPNMLRPALDIISDMLKHTLEERAKSHLEPTTAKGRRGDSQAEASAEASQSPRLHPAPSVYTWSILLHGLLSNRETKSASRVAQMMRQHDIEPNIVTWNTLVNGYARNQDVNKTVWALEGLEAAGYEADEYTLRGFSRLVNKELALTKMQSRIEYKKVKRKAERRAERCAETGFAATGHELGYKSYQGPVGDGDGTEEGSRVANKPRVTYVGL